MADGGSAGRDYAREFEARKLRALGRGYGSYHQERIHRRQLKAYTQHPGYEAGIQGITPVQADDEWMRAEPAPTRFGHTPSGRWPYVRMAEYNRGHGVVHVVFRDGGEGYYQNVDFNTWRRYLRNRSSYLFINTGGEFGGWSKRLPESMNAPVREEAENGGNGG
jgi:hypothetical protein